jgi:predicted MFS family arabinose efflux permease
MTSEADACPASTEKATAHYFARDAQVRIYVVLLLASLAYNYSFILIDYLRPFLVRDLHMTLADTALLYATQGAGVILGSFAVPVFASRWGSRTILALSTLCLALLTWGNLVSGSFHEWAALRFGVGIMLAGSYITSTTMLANFFPPRIRGRLLAICGATFSVALLIAGSVGAAVGESGWRVLIWISILGPLTVAVLTWVALPDDRGMRVYGDSDTATAEAVTGGSWTEMLSGRRRYLTLACLLLAGLNFSGYQFYSGFITTYLMTVRHYDASLAGVFVIIDGIGTLVGSIAWGAIADWKGRRINALGFVLAALFIAAMLVAPPRTPLLCALEFGYAVCLSTASCWAAYFAELFPVRLRPMGTSLFHGGHVISLFAPLVVATVAKSYSLVFGMSLAPLTFLAAAVLWWTLPETLRTGVLYRGFNADAPEAGT